MHIKGRVCEIVHRQYRFQRRNREAEIEAIEPDGCTGGNFLLYITVMLAWIYI